MQFRYWRNIAKWGRVYPKLSYSLKLPEKHFDSAGIKALAASRKLHWMPYLNYQYDHHNKAYYPFIPDLVSLVIDVDQPLDDVVAAVYWYEKWSFANKYPVSISRSPSGNAHIHVLVDVSSVPYMPNYNCDPEHFEVTDRYKAVKKLRTALYESFCKDTGIEPDWQAASHHHVCVTPLEISQFNAVWTQNKAIKYGDIQKDFFKEAHAAGLARGRSRSGPMGDELQRMFQDPNLLDAVMSYNQECGVVSCQRRLLKLTIDWMRTKTDTILAHWVNNPKLVYYLKSKDRDISIKKMNVNMEVFGLEEDYYSTYTRLVALYIFSLKLQDPYIYKQRSNLYTRVNIDKKYFKSEFLKLYWYKENISDNVSIGDELAEVCSISSSLGSGNSYSTIKKKLPFLVARYGQKAAEKIMIQAIQRSNANDKRQRENWVRIFSRVIEDSLARAKVTKEKMYVHLQRQVNNGDGGFEPKPSGFPRNGFLHHKPAAEYERSRADLFAPVQYAY